MEPARPQPDASPVRVLLVDDSDVNRLLACAMLARWGIEPVVARDGAEAVWLVRQQPFDLVLMDVDMPVLDGMLATEQIRRFERDQAALKQVPVVAYTGSPDVDAERVRESGMSDLLMKPCSFGALADCLRRHCADKFVD